MFFGSKYVYATGGQGSDSEEEVVVRDDDDAVLSVSDDSDDGESCVLDVFDTAGQEEYSAMREQYVRTGDGFIIVFSITDRVSFHEAEGIFLWLKRFQSEERLHVVLCGNKTDLTDERRVSREDGQKVADRLGVPYFETSAKTGRNVTRLYQGLMKTIPRTGTKYKVVMLGSGGVGKSSVTLRFAQGIFLDDYDPTIEDSYRKTIQVSGQPKGDRKARKMKNKLASPDAAQTASPRRWGPFSTFLNAFDALLASYPSVQQQRADSLSDDSHGDEDVRPQTAKKPTHTRKERKTDGNVVLLSLGKLADDPQLVTGDPVRCSQCEAVLSSTSTLLPQDDGKKTWICEFCGKENRDLDVENEEIPQGDCFDFMLEPAPEAGAEGAAAADGNEAKKKVSAGYTIYCMDISGSMNTTCQTPELQAAWRVDRTRGRNVSTFQRIRGAVQRWGYFWFRHSMANLSRLQCIKEAVQRQLEQLNIDQPDKPVMLAVFSSELDVKGGGEFTTSQRTSRFTGCDRATYDDLINKGKELARNYQLKPLSDSYVNLDQAVEGLATSGSTALGPALSICAGFVSEVPGSEIVLCTDGMPNVGIGSLQSGWNDTAFYRTIGEYAKANKTVINILAVEGEPVGLPHVQVAAEVSGGTVNMVNPLEIVRQLRQIMQNSLVATAVTVTFFLHPQFVFDEPGYPDNTNRLYQEVGNVMKEDDLSFRFKLKDSTQPLNMENVPFQVQFMYTRKDGRKYLRVLSKTNQATTTRKDMEEGINVSVVGAAAVKKTAALAQAGQVKQANMHLKAVKRLAKRGAKQAEQKEELSAFRDECKDLDDEITDNLANWGAASASHMERRSNMLFMKSKGGHARYQNAMSKQELSEARVMSKASKATYYAHKDQAK